MNSLGYGAEGSGLELNLVSNPTGAFLPASQSETEERFRRVMSRKWRIVFNNLFTFANVTPGQISPVAPELRELGAIYRKTLLRVQPARG